MVLGRLIESDRNGPTSTGPASWKENKKREKKVSSQYFCPWRKFPQVPACLASTLMLVNGSTSRVESQFPTAPQPSRIEAPLIFQARHYGTLSSWSWSDSSLLRGALRLCYPPACGSLTWGCGFWLDCISAPPACLHVALLHILSHRKPVLLVFRLSSESCSTGTCGFGVPAGGVGLRVFQLCHPDLDSSL